MPSLGPGQRGLAGLAVAVDDREVEVVDVHAGVLEQLHEQLVGLVDDLADAGVGAVGLVDHEDDRQALAERLAQHEAGLRQRALGGVDEQDDAVDHRQAALDLATEVGVAGGVDDVDDDGVAVLVGQVDRGVLGEDGDAALALEVHRVHHAGLRLVVVRALALGAPEGAGLAEEGVDQGRLAVVDVGDDRHVAQVVAGGHAKRHLRRFGDPARSARRSSE